MRLNNLVGLSVLACGLAQADLEIKREVDNPRHAAFLQRMQATSAGRSPSDRDLPSLEQLVANIDRARRTAGAAAQQHRFESPSRSALEQLGCTLSNESPSGVERKDGGLNGIASLYECATRYVATFEYTYAVALTQRVVVIDKDFAEQSDPLDPLIKTHSISAAQRRVTHLRWLNPKHELRYEIYANAPHSGDEVFEKRLEAVMKATALKLIEGES